MSLYQYFSISKLLILPLIFTFAIVELSSSEARTFKKIANSGKKTHVNTHFKITGDCRTKPIAIDIVKAPEYGTVTAKLITKKLTKDTKLNTKAKIGSNSSRDFLRRCVGKNFTSIEVFYKSDKGYLGKDFFSYKRVSTVKVDKLNNRVVKMKITVE